MGFWSRLFRRNKRDIVAKQAVPASAATTATPAKRGPGRPPGPAKPAKARTQCAAITADNRQCSRGSRPNSRYCGLHKNYHPPSAATAATAKDTKPAARGVRDTKPARRRKADAARSSGGLRPQCVALTPAGKQCQNSARAGSKYCGAHKSYQPPGAATARAAKDSKPAVPKARDTKPAGRRTQVSRHGYSLYQSGNRYFFSKKPQKDVAGTPVYSMPSGRTVVRTPNGLPVLKRN
jgi:hypothetical protein